MVRRAFQGKTFARNFSAGHGHSHDSHAHDDHAHDNHGHHGHHDSHGHHDDHAGHDSHGHDSHAHHGPHVPDFYDKLGKFCLVTAYVWVMYRFKVDNGQIFGYYKPWLHEHEHEHLHFKSEGRYGENVVLVEDEEEEEEVPEGWNPLR